MEDEMELAHLAVKYRELRVNLQEVERRLSDMVAQLGESREIAGVQMRYTSGVAYRDYSAVEGEAPEEAHDRHRKVCEDMEIDPDSLPISRTTEPRVSIKVKQR